MKELGKIEKILNEDMVIFSSSIPLERDEVLVVYGILEEPLLYETIKTNKLIYPKGEIKVVCNQRKEHYLGERFRPIIEKKSTVKEPSNFQKSTMQELFLPKTKEIYENIFGEWSAEFDAERNINVSINKKITIGDIVARD